MMHVSLVWPSSKVWWQVIFHVNYLSHVLHLVAHPLTMVAVTSTAWPERPDSVRQILVLRGWAVAFHDVKVELVLVWSSTNGSFVHLVRHHYALWFFIIYYLWITHLVVSSYVHRMRLSSWSLILLSNTILWYVTAWLTDLSIIPSGLGSSFDLILNLLSLLLIRLSNGDTLANLLLLGSVKRIHLVMWPHHESLSALRWRILTQIVALRVVHIYFRVIYSVTGVPLWRRRPRTSLSCSNPSLSRRLGFTLIILGQIPLVLLLLKYHLLFYLLLV